MPAYSGGDVIGNLLNLVGSDMYQTPLHPGLTTQSVPNAGGIAGFNPPAGTNPVAGIAGFTPSPANANAAISALANKGSASGGDPGPWGNPATQDGPDAWFANAVLKLMQMPDGKEKTDRYNHLMASVTGPDGPQGSLYNHYYNFLYEAMNGTPAQKADRLNEAHHYGDVFVAGGPNLGE